MQKGLYLTKPSKSFGVVKKTGRGIYSTKVSGAVASSLEDTLAVERLYLEALLIPYPVLMWSKDDD